MEGFCLFRDKKRLGQGLFHGVTGFVRTERITCQGVSAIGEGAGARAAAEDAILATPAFAFELGWGVQGLEHR